MREALQRLSQCKERSQQLNHWKGTEWHSPHWHRAATPKVLGLWGAQASASGSWWSMDCPKSISLMSLSPQLYPLCPHPRMHRPSSLPPAVTHCWPFWLPREELTAICSVHHHPEFAWLRSVSVFRCSVSFHPCANLPTHPGYLWPFDEWPISSRQDQPHWGWHLLPSPT